jgi:hypothetical protein
VIGGPAAGPVPNAGGCPAGGAGGGGEPAGFGVSARATRPTAAAPSRPRTGPFKNCLRELGMAGTVLETGRVVPAGGPAQPPPVSTRGSWP